MYLAHGWPRALDLDLPGQPVASFHDGSVIVFVTSGGLGLWSAGAGGGGGGGLFFDGSSNGETLSSSSSSSFSSSSAASSSGAPFKLATELAPRGETHVAALWRPAGVVSGGDHSQSLHQQQQQVRRLPALAVLSSAGVLRIYGVHFSEERRALPLSAPLGGCYSGGNGGGGGEVVAGGGDGANNASSSSSSSSSAAAADAFSLYGSDDPMTGAGPAAVDLYVTEEIDIVGMSSSGMAEEDGEGEGEGEGKEASLDGGGRGGGVSRPAALAGDASCILVALADGEVLAVTWQGDVRGRARPFDGAAANGGGSSSSSVVSGSSVAPLSPPRSPLPTTTTTATTAPSASPPLPPLLSPSLPSPFPSPSAYRSPPPPPRRIKNQRLPPAAPLVALHYCPASRVAAAAFADGRVALSRASPTAPRPPAALGIPWNVRAGGGGPRARPVAVAVCGAADAVAVGTDLGDVELFPLSLSKKKYSSNATLAPFSSPPFSPGSVATSSGFYDDEEEAPPAPPMRVLSPRGDGDDDGGGEESEVERDDDDEDEKGRRPGRCPRLVPLRGRSGSRVGPRRGLRLDALRLPAVLLPCRDR